MSNLSRRTLFELGALAIASRLPLRAQTTAGTLKGMASPKIKDVQVITTSPDGLRLVVVKVVTDQDGLYGYGCATFTQRADAVVTAVQNYLKPLLVGRPADRIEDAWALMYNSSYWRNSGVLNNAISGVDMALWDIKGRVAGLPVYQLWGGKVREGVAVYMHASGAEIPAVLDDARRIRAMNVRHVRVQIGIPGQAAYGGGPGMRGYEDGLKKANLVGLGDDGVFEPKTYLRRTLKMLEACRKELGEEVELLHDMHERVHPRDAIQFAKDVEQFKLFFLEDPLSPEDNEYFHQMRAQCATPIAMGELFNNPQEWNPLIKDRLIDFIRIHISQAGGVTPVRKIAAMAEVFNVRTAWHGPGDMTPFAQAANIALDICAPNFGIQEFTANGELRSEIFPGSPVMKDGYVYPSEKPGWGIEMNEALAAKYPFGHGETGERKKYNGGWGVVRTPDGTVIKQ